jgi:DNA primase
MENNWVDFKVIKSAVTLRKVLDRYQINWLRKSGDELRGRCPIHEGEGQQSFHVNLAKNAFHCFSCKAHGNVLDFVAAMEKCSVRDAAVKLQEWFSIDSIPAPMETKPPKEEKRGEGTQPENKPLAFELKGIDLAHAYLTERGITIETAETFGVGLYSGRGSMSGRVVMPIHNERGELVAYAGRSIDGSEPRYKLPAGFHKSHVLFNLHRVTGLEVIVVEGFFDCMKVRQAGHASVVALMGSTLSEQQERLLGRFKRVTLFLDGDDAGRKGAEEIAARLMRHAHVRILEPPGGRQPDQLDQEQLSGLLG